MTSLPEQLSAVRTAQLEAQLDFFRRLTAQAFDSTSKLIALNISTSRDSVERTSKAVRELFTAHEPRDLFQLGSHAEEQFRSMFAYSRDLFSIATGAQGAVVRAPELPAVLPSPRLAEAPQAAAPQPAAPQAEPPAPQAVPAPVQATAETESKPDQVASYIQEHVQADLPVVAEPAEPVVEPAPVAQPKPIARAAGKGVAKAAVVPHPVAAPVKTENAAPKIETSGPKRKK